MTLDSHTPAPLPSEPLTTLSPAQSQSLYESLSRAIAAHRLPDLATAIADAPSLASLGDAGNDLLHLAIKNGFTDAFKALLNNGAAIFRRTSERTPLLMNACEHGALEICKMLVAAGVDVNERDSNGDTALHASTSLRSPHPETVCEYLLINGADVNAVNSRNDTPLHSAAFAGSSHRLNLVRQLVAAGASSNFVPIGPEDDYLTPFQLFVAVAQPDTLDYFVRYCGEDPNQLTRNGRTLEDVAFGLDDSMTEALHSARAEWAVTSSVDCRLDPSAHSDQVTPTALPTKFSPI
jgi:ankyrin repeat protein